MSHYSYQLKSYDGRRSPKIRELHHEIAESELRYPAGTIINGRNVGGKFESRQGKVSSRGRSTSNNRLSRHRTLPSYISHNNESEIRFPSESILDGQDIEGQFDTRRLGSFASRASSIKRNSLSSSRDGRRSPRIRQLHHEIAESEMRYPAGTIINGQDVGGEFESRGLSRSYGNYSYRDLLGSQESSNERPYFNSYGSSMSGVSTPSNRYPRIHSRRSISQRPLSERKELSIIASERPRSRSGKFEYTGGRGSLQSLAQEARNDIGASF